MSIKKLCVIPGDGIGPEVVDSATRVLCAAVPDLQLIPADAGWGTFQLKGDSVPAATLELLRDCGAGLFGAVSSPSKPVSGYQSAILKIRQSMDLFANIRPVDSRWAQDGQQPLRLVIVRENTEGLYIRDETSDGETAIAKRRITRTASRRIGWMAAQVAHRYGFSRIHVVHKANVLPQSDGLFRDSVLESIHQYMESNNTSIDVQQALVDITAFRLADEPGQFQVIVTTNMFGDILSDLAATWCGGMGRAPSLNLGEQVALAEPVHGSAPDIVGQGIADPTATILSAALLCRLYWQEPEIADSIESALHRVHADWGTQPMNTQAFTQQLLGEF